MRPGVWRLGIGMWRGCSVPWTGELELSAGQVWTQCHSLAFDFSVWKHFRDTAARWAGWWWCPEPVTRSAEELLTVLVDERVSVLSQTTGSVLCAGRGGDATRPDSQLSLELVVFGGEALEPQRLAPWLDRHAVSPRLINM